ncbi:TolC family outer membrane protein [Piscinibacter sakaiensis]|uniref:Type I secretion outer membrane protein, TolC n=1 Tax=Piscinibacter sakaiensis TaxID=1547922 RepID=A0A0K8NYE3_PISS1|nr:TolC family outer membrane protein [Piscinibacter sakaiensis]GAP34945.1 type I secretion outer membrane protein, TolC precursor [Piscinibacter sakaiensis]
MPAARRASRRPSSDRAPSRPRARGLALLALAAGLVVAGGARAQSLPELLAAARAYDASYLAVRAQTDSAPYRAAQAAALKRPSAGLSASATAGRVDPPNFAALSSNGATLALSGRQALFNRASDATIAQAERQVEAARLELQGAEQDLIIRVAQAYFDVLGAQDTLATTRAAKAQISEQLASAKRNFEVGTATITDTREAQARFDLATAQEIAAENDLRSKRVALDQLVGRSGVAPLPLAVPVALPAVEPADIERWVATADDGHPSIRRARIGLDVARLETDKARAGSLPTVDAVASIGDSYAAGRAAQLNGTRGSTRSASIGVQMSLPLYTGGSVQNRVQETLLLEERARNDLEAARRGVGQATRTAYLGVQSGQAQVKALEAAEASSQLALEATQVGYRVGVRVNVDVLNAQTQLFQTRRDLAQARYNVLLGGLRLRQAAGVLTPDDVAAIDPLFRR